MGGKSGTATTTAKYLPEWVTKAGHHMAVLNRSEELSTQYKLGNIYDGQTYADQTQEEKDGISALATKGRNGSDIIDAVVADAEASVDGDFLLGTTQKFIDMLDNTTQSSTNKFGTGILTELGANLYYVGDSSGENLASDLVDVTAYNSKLEAKLYSSNYEAEIEIQNQVIGISVELGKQPVVFAEALRIAGLYQREYNQLELEDVYKQWYDGEVSKVRYLEVLGNAIRAIVGTETATTKPFNRASPMVGSMGGAMSGAMMGSMIMPGWGTAIGAVAGMAMGFMSSQ